MNCHEMLYADADELDSVHREGHDEGLVAGNWRLSKWGHSYLHRINIINSPIYDSVLKTNRNY
jgi:hypothetical protein